MSRARNIKPGFFKNETLAECDPLARLLFAGLWCEADRAGRLEDRPKRLKAECLPYDDCNADDLLNQLAARGFIFRYVVDGKNFIQIIEFLKHQNPHVRELPSSIPAPSDTKHNLGSDQSLPRHDPGSAKHGTGPADSPFPFPDSPISDSLILEDPASPGADAPLPADRIFGHGLGFLISKGVKERGARSFLGAMRKELADDLLVVQLLVEAERDDVCDPLAWLRAAGKTRLEQRATQTRAGPRQQQLEAENDAIAREWAAKGGDELEEVENADI